MTGHVEVFTRRDGEEWIAYDTQTDVSARGGTRTAAIYNLAMELVALMDDEEAGRSPASEERVRDVLGEEFANL